MHQLDLADARPRRNGVSASCGMKLGCTPPMTTGTPRARNSSAIS